MGNQATVISTNIQKGGSGKTTTIQELGSNLTLLGNIIELILIKKLEKYYLIYLSK